MSEFENQNASDSDSDEEEIPDVSFTYVFVCFSPCTKMIMCFLLHCMMYSERKDTSYNCNWVSWQW